MQLQRVSRCRGAPQNRDCGAVVVAGTEGAESRMGGKLGQGESDTGQVARTKDASGRATSREMREDS